MKSWRDLADLPMPARIARLPKDSRGYPIPVNVLNANGVLDFRATDPVKLERLIDRRCCAVRRAAGQSHRLRGRTTVHRFALLHRPADAP